MRSRPRANNGYWTHDEEKIVNVILSSFFSFFQFFITTVVSMTTACQPEMVIPGAAVADPGDTLTLRRA